MTGDNAKTDPTRLIDGAIRAHLKRCGIAPDSKLPAVAPASRRPLVDKHVLTGSSAERILAPALHPSMMPPASAADAVKGKGKAAKAVAAAAAAAAAAATTATGDGEAAAAPALAGPKPKKPRGSVWFLTEAAGEVDPFVREGLRERFSSLYTFTAAGGKEGGGVGSSSTTAATTAAGGPAVPGGKKERERAEKKARREQAKLDKANAAAAPPPPLMLKIKLKVNPTPAAAAKPAESTVDDSDFSSDDDDESDSEGSASSSDEDEETEGSSEEDETDEDMTEPMDVDVKPSAAGLSTTGGTPSGLPRGFASSAVVDSNGQRCDLRSPAGLPPAYTSTSTPGGPPPPTPMEVLASLGSPRLRSTGLGGAGSSSNGNGHHHRRRESSVELHLSELGGGSPDKRNRRGIGPGSADDFRRQADEGSQQRPFMLSLLPTNTRMTLSFPAVLSPTASPSIPSDKLPFNHPNHPSRAHGGGGGGNDDDDDADEDGLTVGKSGVRLSGGGRRRGAGSSGSYFPQSTPSRVTSPSSRPLLLQPASEHPAPIHESLVEGADPDDETAYPLHLALLSSLKGGSPPFHHLGRSSSSVLLDRSYREGTFDDEYVDAVSICEPGATYESYETEPSPPFEEGCASSPEAAGGAGAGIIDPAVAKAGEWAAAVAAGGAAPKEEPRSPPVGLGLAHDGSVDSDSGLAADDDAHSAGGTAAGGGLGFGSLMDEDFLGPESVGLEELERVWGAGGRGAKGSKKRKRPSVGPLAASAAAMNERSPPSDDTDVVMDDADDDNELDIDDDDDEMDSVAQSEIRRQKEAFAQALVERARSATAVMICPDPLGGSCASSAAGGDDSVGGGGDEDDAAGRARAIKHRRTSSLPKPLPAPLARRKEPSPLGSAAATASSLPGGQTAPAKPASRNGGGLHLRDLVCDAELEGMDDEDDEQAVEQSILPVSTSSTTAVAPSAAAPSAAAPTFASTSSTTAIGRLPGSSAPASAPARPVSGPPSAVGRLSVATRDAPPPHPVFPRPGHGSLPPSAGPLRTGPARPSSAAGGAPSASAPTSNGPSPPPTPRYTIICSTVPLLPEPAKVMSTTICGGASRPACFSSAA